MSNVTPPDDRALPWGEKSDGKPRKLRLVPLCDHASTGST